MDQEAWGTSWHDKPKRIALTNIAITFGQQETGNFLKRNLHLLIPLFTRSNSKYNSLCILMFWSLLLLFFYWKLSISSCRAFLFEALCHLILRHLSFRIYLLFNSFYLLSKGFILHGTWFLFDPVLYTLSDMPRISILVHSLLINENF